MALQLGGRSPAAIIDAYLRNCQHGRLVHTFCRVRRADQLCRLRFCPSARRAKTDRLDTELLKRSFLGWLRGERDHCKMVAIPTTQDEDAKRPNREHESLVGEQSRLVNRMKATLIRFGIRGFNPKLKKDAERLDGLRTPEGEPIPPNTLAELPRNMVRRRLIRDQIRQIEDARLERLKQAPNDGRHAMVRPRA